MTPRLDATTTTAAPAPAGTEPTGSLTSRA